jgi:hypothetical protein
VFFHSQDAISELNYGIYIKTQSSKGDMTILTGECNVRQVSRILGDAIAAFPSNIETSNNIHFSPSTETPDLLAIPEALQSAVNETGSSIHFAWSTPLFR